MAVFEPLRDVAPHFHRDLIAQPHARRHMLDNCVDVGVSGHVRSSVASSCAIAVTNVFHSCLSRASSARPVSVSR